MKPLHTGPGGRSYPCMRQGDLDLGAYLVHVPAAKPHHLQWYVVMGADLSPAEGAGAPYLAYPDAQFEVSIWALSASANAALLELIRLDQLDVSELNLPLVFPQIVSTQFHGITTQYARAVTEAMAAAICTGKLEPKRTLSEAWSRAIQATVSHFKGE